MMIVNLELSHGAWEPAFSEYMMWLVREGGALEAAFAGQIGVFFMHLERVKGRYDGHDHFADQVHMQYLEQYRRWLQRQVEEARRQDESGNR
jgi:hypothetical protein